ncbi:polycomb protein EED [Exophiala viscosa]|uniref:Polycomb protein EED n=1 Tax=Exophiala viscosa TaxID=2486360 RepID=A0AAN6DXB4_9EURO|nr:polycomb protein EED [Exophiala viscosa]KAI1625649.1 polycomb protein EED [Exophiala viscosa]
MASQAVSRQSFILPKLKHKFKSEPETDRFAFYDVKFYPYSRPPIEEPVFAVVSQRKVYIGRLSAQSNASMTMLHELVDQQETDDPNSPGLNSCSWCYIDQQRPLLAVAGGSGQLKVIDAVEGDLFTTLVGHGHGTINDIATHPRYPWIVATASMDKSLRIWDLRRHANRYESSTIIICGQATGHCEGVLCVSWHASGRYLVTGGHDQRICVWTIPDLDDKSSFWQHISPEHRKRSSDDVFTIYYPHFVSSAVHSNFVDCAKFFGDLIISKAANENKLVLWKVTGFDSRLPPPDSTTAPKVEEYLDTRNGFMRSIITRADGVANVDVAKELEDQPLYERLLEFETPRIEQFYLRFGLSMPSAAYPDLHPVLAFANAHSELRFWDLERLALGHAGSLEDGKNVQPTKRKQKGIARTIKPQDRLKRTSSTPNLYKEESPVSLDSTPSSGLWPRQSSTEATSETSYAVVTPQFLRDRDRYPIHNAHEPLKPHAKVSLVELQFKNVAYFNARAADWSPCGRWCIVAGESARVSSTGVEGIGGFAVLYR